MVEPLRVLGFLLEPSSYAIAVAVAGVAIVVRSILRNTFRESSSMVTSPSSSGCGLVPVWSRFPTKASPRSPRILRRRRSYLTRWLVLARRLVCIPLLPRSEKCA